MTFCYFSNVPTLIPDCDLHSPALLDFFLSSDSSICFSMAFPPLANSDDVIVSVSIHFPPNSKLQAPFHSIAYDYSHADWDSLHDHLNSLKFSFTNIQGLCLNFVECKSFLESNSCGILAICETNFNDLIDSGKFSVVDYLSLIQKGSNIHMHGLVVYVMEGFPFAWDLSLESSVDSYLCF